MVYAGQHCRGASKHAVPVTERYGSYTTMTTLGLVNGQQNFLRVAGKDTDYERGLNLKCLCGQSAKL